MKYIPWGIVVALVLGFGAFCRQQAIASVENQAQIEQLKTTAQTLQVGMKWYVSYADSLQKDNARKDRAIRESAKRERAYATSLDSLLALHPVVDAPESCAPWVQGLTICQQIVAEVRGQRDSAVAKQINDSVRADSATALAKRNRRVADSLVSAWPKPSWFKDLTNRGSAVTFLVGLLVGVLAD